MKTLALTFLLSAAVPCLANEMASISATFPAEGVSRVILRAGAAEQATVSIITSPQIRVFGVPSGGAKGYHSPDPNWKETPPNKWGLNFVSERFGNVLVISTKNEIAYIHHRYDLKDLHIELPAGITLSKENRILSGDGAADLRLP